MKAHKPSLLQWVKLKATGKFSSAIIKSIKKEKKLKSQTGLKETVTAASTKHNPFLCPSGDLFLHITSA